MRMPPLLADFIYSSDCKLICEKSLTLPFEAQNNETHIDRINGIKAERRGQPLCCLRLFSTMLALSA